jgi:hypothetical protein|tara:strand:+ start:2421 stop:2813 length:393 start_codon:yes stop_codon:yes gene_type:complete
VLSFKIAALLTAIILLLAAFAIDALSQVNINTSSSQKSTNYDEIEAYGVKCRQAIGSNLNVEAGIGQAQEANNFDAYDANNNGSDRVGLFARISYALGAPKRLDCGRIYQLTIYRLQRELLLLNKQPVEE